MSRTALVAVGVLLGAVAAGFPLWLWSDQRMRQIEATVTDAEAERAAEKDRLERQMRDLQAENGALKEKLTRVAELIAFRRRAKAMRYRPYQLQVRVGGCGDAGPRQCPPGFWPLLGNLIKQATYASQDLAGVEERFIADFGADETARVYAADDTVACGVWRRREDAFGAVRRGDLSALRIAEEATDEFIAKWGAPEVYMEGSRREPALCKLGEAQRVPLYASILTQP